jgi:excisionase family DNA binding protein
MAEGLLTEEEVKSYLKVSEEEVNKLKHKGKLTAYKVGGSFVRYRKDEVLAVRSGKKFRLPDQLERGWFDRVRDFLSFYGVYIIISAVIFLLVIYFVQS